MPPSGSLPLHVANGTSTTRTIEAAGIAGATSIWADPLYEGPVPGNVSDEGLLQVRANHQVAAACAIQIGGGWGPELRRDIGRAGSNFQAGYGSCVPDFQHQIDLLSL